MIKNLSLTFLALLWVSIAFSQNSAMQRFIDKDNMVFVVNLQPSLTYDKLNKETKEEYEINKTIASILLKFTGGQPSDELLEKVSAQLEDPNKVGINVKDEVYIWGQRPATKTQEPYLFSDNKPFIVNIIIPVTDQKKFKSFLDEIVPEPQKSKIVVTGTNATLLNNGIVATWNDERVIISATKMKFPFPEDEKRRNEILLQHASDLTKVNPNNSLKASKELNAYLDKTVDVSFWADYNSLFMNSYTLPKPMQDAVDALHKLTKNTTLSGKGVLKNGKAEINTNFSMNAPMKRVTDAAYNKSKLHKQFFKYVDKNNLMGLSSFSIDLKSFMTSYGQELYKILKDEDTKETKIMTNMIDIVDVFLDEEDIYDLFTGDVLLALTDIRAIQREKTRFKYNDETDTWDEAVEVIDDVVPIINMMFSCGNESNLMHFINLGVNLGGLEQQQEGVWKISSFKKTTGMDMFVILKDGMLMFTNDNQIPSNINGFPTSKQLPSSTITELSNYVMYGMLDASKISKVVQDAYANQKENIPNDIMELEKLFNKIEFKSTAPVGNDFKTSFHIEMKDNKTTALQLLLNNIEQSIMDNSSSFEFYQEGIEGEVIEEEEEEEDEGVKRL